MGQNGSKWPFWGLFWASGAPKGRWEPAKFGQKAIKMCIGAVLYHLDAILVHFEPKLKIIFFSILRPFWAILGPFGALLGPFLGPFWALLGPREPSKAGGNWPRAAKRGSKGHRNVFWDRFRPFGCHFSAFRAETENLFFFDFEAILGHFWALFGPFFGPLNSAKFFWGPPPLPQYKKKNIVF